jgi:HPt (histidine-containing phosphotransfer) domain-containing protein
MIDTLSTPFPPPPPVLGASLSRQGSAEVKTAPAAEAGKAAPEAPVLPEEALPKLASFPQVLESFFYRYQLDLDFSLSSSSTDNSLPGPQISPPEASKPEPLPLRRADAPEPGSRRAVIASAFTEVRSFQVRTFTRHADQLAGQLSPATGEKLRRTSRSVGRAFSMDFSLKISFLQQFSQQTETLAGQGEGVLSKYLDVSRTLSLRSGGEVRGFFDQVDQLLAQTEQTLRGGVDAFLQEMKGQLGLGEEDLAGMGALLHQGIAEFFAEAADFLDQAEAQLAGQVPDLPPPEMEAALAA